MTDIPQILVEGERWYRDHSPSMRRGQAYFNALAELDPTAAETVRGSLADPFYDDSRIGDFLHVLENVL